MWFFNWLFRKPATPGPAGLKRYEYPTANIEFGIRVARGEFVQALSEEIRPRWTPGNEYLWDEFDPESFLDTPEKRYHIVNALLFGRITVYRALLASGRDVRGSDPFQFQDQVPEAMAWLRERFPGIFGDGPRPTLQIVAVPMTLSPGDPGMATPDQPG